MKEKRYEIIKRKERESANAQETEGRNPPGMNALGAPDASMNGNVLENRSRYETCAPRSSLNNNLYNLLSDRRAPDPKPDGKPKGRTPGVPQEGAQTPRRRTPKK